MPSITLAKTALTQSSESDSYLRVDAFFFLLDLLHTAQTSIEGLVGLVRLVHPLSCLWQLCLQWEDGVGPQQDTLVH